MKKNTSLMELLKENTDINIVERLEKVSKKIEKDQTTIRGMADRYSDKYQQEIEMGTRKKQLLLSEGKSEESIVRENGFIPSIYTPILNWLYFFMKENEINKPKKEMIFEEKLEEENRHLLHEKQNVDSMKNVPETFTLLTNGKITHDQYKTLKKLKTLSESDNENEAFSAYRACLKFCKKYNITFDQLP